MLDHGREGAAEAARLRGRRGCPVRAAIGVAEAVHKDAVVIPRC